MSYADSLGRAGLLGGAAGSTLLSQISDALSWPRRTLWSILGGPEQGEDLPLIRDVENPLLRSILGFGAESVLDPFNITGAVLGRLGGRALGVALDQGGGVANLNPLRHEYTVLKDVGSHIGKQLEPVPDYVVTRSGALDVPVIGKPQPFGPKSSVELPSGQNYIQSGYTGTGSPGTNVLGRPVGGVPRPYTDMSKVYLPMSEPMPEATARIKELRGELRDAEDLRNIVGSSLQGYYDPSRNAVVQFHTAVDPIDTIRHENVHALVSQAGKRGELERLPLALRTVKRLRSLENDPLKALGMLGEETLAQGIGSSRNLMDQARRGWQFLENPLPAYEQMLESVSPLIAQMYRERMFTGLPIAAGVTAASLPIAAGLYWLLNNLNQTSSTEQVEPTTVVPSTDIVPAENRPVVTAPLIDTAAPPAFDENAVMREQNKAMIRELLESLPDRVAPPVFDENAIRREQNEAMIRELLESLPDRSAPTPFVGPQLPNPAVLRMLQAAAEMQAAEPELPLPPMPKQHRIQIRNGPEMRTHVVPVAPPVQANQPWQMIIQNGPDVQRYKFR